MIRPMLRGLANSEPMIAPIGIVATSPNTSTQARVSHAPTPVDRPSNISRPGTRMTARLSSDMPPTSVILPIR